MAEPLSPADFWRLLLESHLLTAGEVAALREEQGAGGGPASDAAAIAAWLGRRGRITSWQARQLLKGRSGPFLLGDYTLLEQKKAPFAGHVFRGLHRPSRRPVCLVVLDNEACDDPATWQAIVQATQAATGASDPVLSRTWALEQIGRRRVVVCEEVEGPTLAARLAGQGPLPLPEAATLVFAVTRAVAELHRLGIVHGGISLDTILESATEGVADDDAADGTRAAAQTRGVRLLQFPQAGDPHRQPPRLPLDDPRLLEALGQRICFAAPELARPGSTATATSDVYALGCVLSAVVTGRLPNWAGTVSGTLARTADTGLASQADAGVPEEITTAIAYMTDRDPLARYPSAVDAAAAVAACFGLPEFPLDPPATAVVAGEPAAAFSTITASAPGSRSARRRRRGVRTPGSRRWPAVAAAAVALVTLVAGGIGIWQALRPYADGDREQVAGESDPSGLDEPATGPAAGIPEEATEAALVRPQELVDDERLPWASPTMGPPPAWRYLPPGSQLMLAARPAALLADDEGRRFVRALGPAVEEAIVAAERLTGHSREDFIELAVGWGSTADGGLTSGFTITLGSPLDPATLQDAWKVREQRPVGEEVLYEAPGLTDTPAFWLPTAEQGRVLVIGSAADLTTVIESDGQPLLSPSFEQLMAGLDATRHLILAGSPGFLRNDGRLLLPDTLAGATEELTRLLGEKTLAAAASLFIGETCFIELDVVPTAAEPVRRQADRLAERIGQLAEQIEPRCLALAGSAYGGRLIGRLPAMLRVVAAELRWGEEAGLAVITCQLPREAAHNLALATELAISQEPGQVMTRPVAAPESEGPSSVTERLARNVSMVFAKDTLEKSIEMLAQESGLPMEILGADLQLEGITKNQSFGLDEQDRSVDDILRTILRKANPDGKLVYVIRGEGEGASLVVTTRAAVAKRGETLPPGFEEPSEKAD
jgi:hypothetical protein